MQTTDWHTQQAQKTLHRLMPRLEPLLAALDAPDAQTFKDRLNRHFPRLFTMLHALYGDQYDFFYHLEQILRSAVEMYAARPADLKALDQQREADPLWFHSHETIGYVCYVGLFAETINNLREKIPYLKELGVTYLHLMPPFATPETHNDGGYAVSDYRTIRPDLGTMADLSALADEMRAEGISLVLDFVFNHTSDEHPWAEAAKNGDPVFRDYYYTFPDRTLPDQYERTLREIFPDQAPGSFVYNEQMGRWVWSTFYTYQWDLNYSNPEVFDAMLREMLFLANQGVEVLRLDAVAFIWKQMGTASESLPQAHYIIRAYNALVQIVAPAMYFKSEAIVHPSEVNSYVNWEEAPLSYNPLLMALLWESLATRKVSLLQWSMSHYYDLPPGCLWVNYVRVHDDIGWTFADEDAAELGINAFDHRQFLNRFYTGEFPGTFARGIPFGYNPINQDMRISGTAASLAGLEQALEYKDPLLIDHALRRLLMIHSVIISAGGIPLVYAGDELAMRNDYRYKDDPYRAKDTRWAHRQPHDWDAAARRHNPETVAGRMFTSLKHLLEIRKQHPVFASMEVVFFNTQNPHLLGYLRGKRLLALANFSESEQTIAHDVLSAYASLDRPARNLLTGETVHIKDHVTLEPLSFIWWLLGDA